MKKRIHWVNEWNTFAECGNSTEYGDSIPLEAALSQWDEDSNELGNFPRPDRVQNWTHEAISQMIEILDTCDEREGDES